MQLPQDIKMTVAEMFRHFPKGTTATIKFTFESTRDGGFTAPVASMIQFHLPKPARKHEARKETFKPEEEPFYEPTLSRDSSPTRQKGAHLWQEMEKIHAKKKHM